MIKQVYRSEYNHILVEWGWTEINSYMAPGFRDCFLLR